MATFGDFRDSGTSVFITDIVMLGKLILRSTKKVILAYTTFDTKKKLVIYWHIEQNAIGFSQAHR